MSELKPCPFCGRADALKIEGTAVDTKYTSKAVIEWKITCECGCELKVTNINDLSRVIGRLDYREVER